jgi:glycosyltransferase involved in cell wall biosynthesis
MVVANSDYTGANFTAAGVRCPVRTVYYAIDPDRYNRSAGDRAAGRRRLGLANGTAAVGVVGQITPWKGQETAIRAMARVIESHPDSRLLVVGDAKFVGEATRYDNRAYLRRLHGLVEELELEGAVRFLGERRDVPDVLAALDLLLMPSWEEPFGRIAVEAMAIGTPVIATAVGGPPEFIDDPRTGRLLPPWSVEKWAGEIVTLLDDPGEREGMATAAQPTAARFTKEAHVEGMLDAYRDALAAR